MATDPQTIASWVSAICAFFSAVAACFSAVAAITNARISKSNIIRVIEDGYLRYVEYIMQYGKKPTENSDLFSRWLRSTSDAARIFGNDFAVLNSSCNEFSEQYCMARREKHSQERIRQELEKLLAVYTMLRRLFDSRR